MSTLKLNRQAGQRAASAEGDTLTAERDSEQTRGDGQDGAAPAATQAVTGNGAVEGEGSYSAAAQYNRATQTFVETHDVEAAARDAEPGSPAEAAQLANAENKGRSRSRGEDGQTPRRRGRFLRRRR